MASQIVELVEALRDLAALVNVEGSGPMPMPTGGVAGLDWRVLIVDSTGAPAVIGGGTQYADGATQANPTGNVALWLDSGNVLRAASATKPLPVSGSLTNNNAAPGATNVGTLNALCNTAAPTYTNGNQVMLSMTTFGYLRSVVAGTVAAGSAAEFPVVCGMLGTSAFARYLTSATAAFPTTGDNALAVAPGVWDGTNWQKAAQVSQVTGTTGAGLPSHGPCLWDLVGTTNFVKQAGDGSGRAMVVGAVAAGVAVAGNPVAIGISDGTNVQYAKASADGTNALLVAPAISGAGADGITNVSTVKNAGGGTTPFLVLGSIYNGTTHDRARSIAGAQATTGTGLPGVGPLHQAFAHGANPTAVTAGQYAFPPANRAGVPFVMGGHPNIQTFAQNYTGAQTDAAVVTVATGLKIVVTGFLIACSTANTVNVSARLGFGTVNTPAYGAAQLIGTHPNIAPGSGFGRGGGSGIIGVGTDDQDLRFTCSVPTGGSVDVMVSYYTVES